MLVLYKNKPNSNSISINSSRPSSSRSNQHNLALDHRPSRNHASRAHSNMPVQRMNNIVSRVSDDMVSSQKGLRPQMFREFEDFQSGFMRQVSNMFGDLGFGGMGSHTPVVRSQGTAKIISKTYVYSTKIDGNGRMYAEKYFSNDVAVRGSDGTTMHERQQAYHNTGNNLQRIAEERRINHQGKKLTQQRIKGQDTVAKQIQYYNMEENEVDHFDQNWDFQSRKLGMYGGSQKRVIHDPQDVPFIPSSTRHHRNEPDRENRYFDFGHLDQDVQLVPRPRTSRNEDRPININNPHNHARVRRNDIQPAQPGRAIALPRNEAQNDAPGRPRPVNSRQSQRQPREQNHVVENAGHEQVHERHMEHEHNYHHEPAPRVRTANTRRNNEAGLRGDGNFKNKHIPTAMPEAG